MSSSKKIQERKEELAQKEKLLLADFKTSKTKKIVLWSLGAGLAALVGYGIYRSFSSEPKNPKKKKTKRIPKDSPIIDSAIENLAPTLGKWLLKQLKD